MFPFGFSALTVAVLSVLQCIDISGSSGTW